jgi:hypothetical protein
MLLLLLMHRTMGGNNYRYLVPRGGIDRISSTCDERDHGHWYPKGRVFLLWTVGHLTNTGGVQ